MMLFDDFDAGAVLGRHVEPVDDALLGQWRAVFHGHQGTPSPGGLAMAFAMRAYLTVLPKRPPGNIHARQRLKLHGPVKPGERIEATLRCVGKELRNDRRRLTLAVSAQTSDGSPWFDAEMTILWAR
jgi:acyl dehydratase